MRSALRVMLVMPSVARLGRVRGEGGSGVAVSVFYHLPELLDKIKRCIMGNPRGSIEPDHSHFQSCKSTLTAQTKTLMLEMQHMTR